MRSGTENVPGIAGMGRAAREIYTDHQQKVEYITGLKDYMTDPHGVPAGRYCQQPQGNGERAPDCQRKLSGCEKRGPSSRPGGQGNLCFFRIRLFFQSPGNQRNLKGHSGSGRNCWIPRLRFSFGVFNTREEIDYCMEVLEELLPVLRRYHRAEPCK